MKHIIKEANIICQNPQHQSAQILNVIIQICSFNNKLILQHKSVFKTPMQLLLLHVTRLYKRHKLWVWKWSMVLICSDFPTEFYV